MTSCVQFVSMCDLSSYLVNGVPSRSPRLLASGDDSVDSLLQRMVQHEDHEPLEKNIDAVIASASGPPSSSPGHSHSKERALGKPDSLLVPTAPSPSLSDFSKQLESTSIVTLLGLVFSVKPDVSASCLCTYISLYLRCTHTYHR